MNPYRTALLAAAACTAAISLAACTVTTTTASPASSLAPAGSTVSVSGPIGRFPLPPGAQLIGHGTDNGHYDIVFASVSPSGAARFYTMALPQAGYTITSNSSAAGDSFSGTGIWFTGHGYNGQIGALSSFHIPGISLGGNTVEITLTPQLGQGRPQPVSVRNRHPDSVGPAELESARTASVAVRSAASPPEGEQGCS